MGDVDTVIRYLRKWGLGVSRTVDGFHRGSPTWCKHMFVHESPVSPMPWLDLSRGMIYMPRYRELHWKHDKDPYTLLHEGAHLIVNPASVHTNEDGVLLAFEGASVAWLEGRGANVKVAEWVRWHRATGFGEDLQHVMQCFANWFPEAVSSKLFTAKGEPTFNRWKPDPSIVAKKTGLFRAMQNDGVI